mmetsp:Transcript_22790/g.49963  ORF Transcript_22790/g.49963 Transcript_22790/m.49963 type:complete len:209 (-) Transcript_22790:26-652(-)
MYCTQLNAKRLSGGRAALQAGSLLAGELGGISLLSLLSDGLLLLGEGNLNVAGGRHVRVDATVGTVGAAALLLGLVHLDVGNGQGVDVQTLHLGVALGVLEETQEELARLGRPAGLAVSAALVLGLRSAANATAEATEGDGALVIDNVLQVLLGDVQGHLADGHGRLTRVLEVNTEVGPPSLARLGGVVGLLGVLNHLGCFSAYKPPS